MFTVSCRRWKETGWSVQNRRGEGYERNNHDSPDLERRIAEFAAAQGKNLQQMAIEALVMIFDPAEELEDDRTLRALESARRGEGRPAKEALEEIRVMPGIPADAKRQAQ